MRKKYLMFLGGLKDYDHAEIHRQKIREAVPGLPSEEHERLFQLLMEFPPKQADSTGASDSPLAVILFSRDEFLKHIVSTICKHEGIFIVSTDEEENLDLVAEQTLVKELVPLLIIDAPDENSSFFSAESIITLLLEKVEKFPQLSILQLAAPRDYEFPLRALQSGARYVLSRPGAVDHTPGFVEDTVKFLKALHAYIKKSSNTTDHQILRLFKESIYQLGTLREVPEVAFIPLRFASALFERCLTLVVGKLELIAEKGFGIKGDKNSGPSAPLLFKIPLTGPSVFSDVVQSGRFFYGQCNDDLLRNRLFAEIGAPRSTKIVLMPIKNFGRVIAVIYADFGDRAVSSVQLDLLDIVARHAGLVLDNNLYRKKYEKPADSNS